LLTSRQDMWEDTYENYEMELIGKESIPCVPKSQGIKCKQPRTPHTCPSVLVRGKNRKMKKSKNPLEEISAEATMQPRREP
jgi:hypothetical protein